LKTKYKLNYHNRIIKLHYKSTPRFNVFKQSQDNKYSVSVLWNLNVNEFSWSSSAKNRHIKLSSSSIWAFYDKTCCKQNDECTLVIPMAPIFSE
jgi:hypothetical protein